MEILFFAQTIQVLITMMRKEKGMMNRKLRHIARLLDDDTMVTQLEFQIVFGNWLAGVVDWCRGRDKKRKLPRLGALDEDEETKEETKEGGGNGFRSHEMLPKLKEMRNQLSTMEQKLEAALEVDHAPSKVIVPHYSVHGTFMRFVAHTPHTRPSPAHMAPLEIEKERGGGRE
jgi:hypothetical protein